MVNQFESDVDNKEAVLKEKPKELEGKPEFVSLFAANAADLSCPGCHVSSVLD